MTKSSIRFSLVKMGLLSLLLLLKLSFRRVSITVREIVGLNDV